VDRARGAARGAGSGRIHAPLTTGGLGPQGKGRPLATTRRPPAGPDDVRPDAVAPRRSDRSPWNWLLLIPIVVPLLVPLYNAVEPTLFDWPRFYWLQLAFVALGVATTALVYRMTRRSPEERAAAARAATRDRER
jgi:Protein of unknown function (DUF3311)